MSKEIVYIDINDDITNVIEKIKYSKEKIVALVPPKQVGLLQSAVNLQLLARAAKDAKKYIVIITTKDSLAKLASLAKIPVAKTLQSKPALAKLPIDQVEDDLIDGETMPVGELVAASSTSASNTKVKTADVIDNPDLPTPEPIKPVKTGWLAKLKASRKKLILAGLAVLLLAGVLVWALVFAPQANIVLKTKTKLVNVNQKISLTEDSSKANYDNNVIHAQSQVLEKSRKLEFVATGEKNVGEKATGQIEFSTNLISLLNKTIPAGTVLTTSGGLTFSTNSAVTFTLQNYSGATVTATATAAGTSFNGATGTLTGAPANVSAKLKSATTGGTDKMVKIVTENDIKAAADKLAELGKEEAISELKNKFDASALVINESLKIEAGEVKSSIEVGKEAPEDKATVEQSVKYSMIAIVRSRLVEYVNQLVLKQEQDIKVKQKVYQSGDDQLQFDNFEIKEGVASVKIITQVRIGPDLSVEEIKEFAKGKNFGEIQNRYEAIEGVDSVKVDFRPMWVRRVPNNDSRITVSIDLQ